MKYCCFNCFTDVAIQELIYREATIKNCSFCNSEEVACVEPDSLTGLFELILSCIKEDEDGVILSKICVNDLRIISEELTSPERLINIIMGEGYEGKKYTLLDEITEYQTAWESFKYHLINENRFFPSDSLFGKIFKADINNEENISKEASIFLRTLSSLMREKSEEQSFYRARISEKKLKITEMGTPPTNLVSAGRANPVGIPYLYLAEDEPTCFKEVRPSNGATIYLSKITPIRPLKLVDLTNPKLKIALLKFEEEEIQMVLKCLNLLQQFSEELSKPVLPENSHLEYIPTQFICEYIRTLKSYDGLIFSSSYGEGKNVVLFSEDCISIADPEAFKVTSVDVQVTN